MNDAQQLLLFIISEPVGSPIANEVAYRLADRGVRTWIGSLAPEGELNGAAMDALRASTAALLIFDRAAAGSRHTDRHLLVARQTGKPLIPLRVQPADEGLLRQELLDARWIDWSSPEVAVDEIERRARDFARGPAQPAGAAPATVHDFRQPRIQVVPSGAAAAAAAPVPDYREPAMHPGAAEDRRPRAEPPAPPVAPHRARSRFASPTLLLALLALLAVAGAVLYNSSLFQGGSRSTEREVTASREPVDYSASPTAYDEAPPPAGTVLPEQESTSPVPSPPPGFEPESAPAAAPVQMPAAPPTQVAAAEAAPPPAPAPDPAPPAAGSSSAAAAVQSFYSALSSGNGASAAQFVVPEKRRSGPLSGGALTRYYSSFRRPLRVRRVTPVDANTVRVAYDYVLADGRLCEGQAAVNVVQSGGRSLVSSIRTQGPC